MVVMLIVVVAMLCLLIEKITRFLKLEVKTLNSNSLKHACTVAAVSTPVVAVTNHLRLHTMSKVRKEDVIHAIQEFRETPPSTWTLTELKMRLDQLRAEHGITKQNKGKTDLRQWVIQLNVASKKKANLQEFCKKLDLPLTHNETIAQLQKRAMAKIYDVSQPDPADPVGFGKAASLTYEEVKQDVNYCKWVVQTWEEGSTCPQLGRLARWLKEGPIPVKQEEDALMKNPEPKLTALSQATLAKKEEDAHSTTSHASSQALLEAMATVMGTMKDIKEELSDLRQQRSRKKVESDGSFTVMTTP